MKVTRFEVEKNVNGTVVTRCSLTVSNFEENIPCAGIGLNFYKHSSPKRKKQFVIIIICIIEFSVEKQ